MKTAGFDRARELVAAYGAMRSRWPEAERALHDLLAQHPEGQDLLAEATRLEAELDALMTRPADPLRPARILKAARAASQRRRMVRWVSLAYAASMVLGLSLGYGLSAEPGADESYSGLLIGSTVIEDFL
jgi:ferric-dicitrate binding protein FerR (iron transport regulator)